MPSCRSLEYAMRYQVLYTSDQKNEAMRQPYFTLLDLLSDGSDAAKEIGLRARTWGDNPFQRHYRHFCPSQPYLGSGGGLSLRP